MSKKLPGRNQPCPCGSDKKYKRCCLLQKSNEPAPCSEVDQMINDESSGIMSHDGTLIEASVASLQRLRSRCDLSKERFAVIVANLVRGLQSLGRHTEALSIINELNGNFPTTSNFPALFLHLPAISLAALGELDEACNRFEEALARAPLDASELRAGISLEAGRAYSQKGDTDRARQLWTEALEYFERTGNTECIARARSNLGFILLKDSDPDKQKSGLQMIEQASSMKAAIGDRSGLSVNYCNLSLYHRRQRRYARAIAYARKDLALSRQIGDLTGVATSLMNLGSLYMEMKQPNDARRVTREAYTIGEKLQSAKIIYLTKHNLTAIEDMARELAKLGEPLGIKAPCECGSGKVYQECCGRADFEPMDFNFKIELSPEVEKVDRECREAGVESSHLDYFFRDNDATVNRLSWRQIHMHDGWMELRELPDMTNMHMHAARTFATESQTDSESHTKPLAAVVLAVCGLEAFINHAAFFLHKVQMFPERKFHPLPVEMQCDTEEFQRKTGLMDKWRIVGTALCGKRWPPSGVLASDFNLLVTVRNELVHFKSSEYEAIYPPPRQTHSLLRRLPSSVSLRNINASWPVRVLTPSLAEWAVKVADGTMKAFRMAYRESRLAQNSPTNT